MNAIPMLPTILGTTLGAILCLNASAQTTQTLRGKVEDVPGTTNQFVLACTNLRLSSSTLNLNNLVGNQYVMQVVASGSTLDVRTASATTKIFDIGNIRLGRADTWEVTAPAGSSTVMAATFTSMTSYAPMGPLGTYLLGPTFAVIASGRTNQVNKFEFKYQPPSITALVGISITGQALVQEQNGNLYLSNPDCKSVRAN